MTKDEIDEMDATIEAFDGELLTAATFARMVEAAAKALSGKRLRLGDIFSDAPTRAEHDALAYVTGKWLERIAR